MAKGVQAPIFHVNGDDPEAVTFACKMAIEFRQRFDKDVVIDMWCYRRFGHNEGDEPSFTQPLMYAAIRQHPPVSEVYAPGCASRRHRRQLLQQATDEFVALLEDEFQAATTYKSNHADWFAGRWSGLHQPADIETARKNVDNRHLAQAARKPGRTLTTVPDDLNVHKTLRVSSTPKARCSARPRISTGDGGGAGLRLAALGRLRRAPVGQDSGRGTFSQRHAVWVDQDTERRYIPLATVPHGRFDVLDSPLSEYGVLGFEYGYAMADPKSLVMWKRSSAISPTARRSSSISISPRRNPSGCAPTASCCCCRTVYEGQGPEHSSARVERFLQLCAEGNIQVANCTTPANYFHILRRRCCGRSASR